MWRVPLRVSARSSSLPEGAFCPQSRAESSVPSSPGSSVPMRWAILREKTRIRRSAVIAAPGSRISGPSWETVSSNPRGKSPVRQSRLAACSVP